MKKALSQAVVPDGVRRIATRAFAYCIHLENVELPASLESIERRAFYRCKSLAGIDIAPNVRVDETAFDMAYDAVLPEYQTVALLCPEEMHASTASRLVRMLEETLPDKYIFKVCPVDAECPYADIGDPYFESDIQILILDMEMQYTVILNMIKL
ncbi:MAG: leucine-rich repeat domain-containing protein [Lachnospiraceae bacterium]|nr:leucine-rich repeat domain-containing protein [Lachnospiraceae bacterium]